MATHKPVEVMEIFGELTPSKENEQWIVIYTKPKREKKLAEVAFENSITYYLPLIESERHYKYRKVKFTKPLFPGYLFSKVSFAQKEILYKSGHTASFLKVQNEKQFLKELSFIYHGIELGAELKKHQYIESGTYVEVIAGPFKGLKGIVDKNNSRFDEIILLVDELRSGVSLKISPDKLKIIEKEEY